MSYNPRYRIATAMAVAAILLLLSARPAAACSGFVDCLFGFTDRTEIRNDRMIEVARIEAAADAEAARIEGEAAEALRQADAEIARIAQDQYKTETQRAVAIAEAETRRDEYRAMIEGLTAERVAGVNSNADTQIAALQGQAQIAIAGINQAGANERWRVIMAWLFAIVLLVALVAVWWLYVKAYGPAPLIVMLPDSPRWPQLTKAEKNATIVRVRGAK